MNTPIVLWAKLTLRLALVLLAVGLLPILAVAWLLPGTDPLIPTMLGVFVAPLGGVCLLVSVILFLVALARRVRGSS